MKNIGRKKKQIAIRIKEIIKRFFKWLKEESERGAEIHNRMKTMRDERHRDTNNFFLR